MTTFEIGDKVDCWNIDDSDEKYGERPTATLKYTATVVATDGMPGAVCIQSNGFCGWHRAHAITPCGENPVGMTAVRK